MRIGMPSVESNFRSIFFSKLSELRIWEKYSDVTIECGDKSFACHRIVLAAGCEYFDTMFSSGFEEDVAGKIVLHDVDAKSFDLVLQFLYSGKLMIDAESVCNLIRISDFMGMKDLEELCVQFVSENRRIINAVEVYQLAIFLNKKVLIDMLGSYDYDMTEPLEEYFKSDFHLGLPYNVFAMIVKQWKASSQDAIVRWTNACIETRRQYFDELVKTHAEAIIPDFGALLYVHVKGYNLNEILAVKVWTINGAHSTNRPVPLDVKVNENVTEQNVVSEHKRLFILRLHNKTTDFFMSESVDLHPTCKLKPPRVVGGVGNNAFLLRNMSNQGIYLYDRCYLETNSTNEEVHRGILFYDYGVDDWFNVPQMRKHSKSACMTILDDRVYLINGNDGSGYMQAYDHRTGIWLEMPNAKTHYDCCTTMNGAIYVCGSVDRYTNRASCTDIAEKFNIVAGKWEQITPPPPGILDDSEVELISYAGQLWMFGYDEITQCLILFVYDPVLSFWREIREPITERCINGSFFHVARGFVFKSL